MHAFKRHMPVGYIGDHGIPCFNATPVSSMLRKLQRKFRPARSAPVSTGAPSSWLPTDSSQQLSAAQRILFIGGLPGASEPYTLAQQIRSACNQCSYQPARVEVNVSIADFNNTHLRLADVNLCNGTLMQVQQHQQVAQFQDDSERSRFMTAWKHKGHAFVAFTSSDAVSAAAEAVKLIPGWGQQATVGPARKLPPQWTPEITMTPEELAGYQQQQTAAAARRKHNKRQRQRQQQRVADSVAQILQVLPPPGGTAVVQQYQPLLGDVSSLVPAFSSLQSSQRSHDDITSLLSSAMPVPLRSAIKLRKLQHLLTMPQQPQRLIQLAAAPSVADISQQTLFDWSKIPKIVDPAYGGQLGNAGAQSEAERVNLRALRKRVQVESFALLLLQLTLPALISRQPLHVVEFGCGSGNLVLPLAHLFPCFTFTAVDMKHSAVQLLQQRVQQGNISNVDVVQGTIEQYSGPADVVLALHACGAASDWSLLQAERCRAAFIVSPCCIGKISKDNSAGLRYKKQRYTSSSSSSSSRRSVDDDADWQQQAQSATQQQLAYPRSQWMTRQMQLLTLQVKTQLQRESQAQPSPFASQQTLGQLNLLQRALNPLQQAVVTAADECVHQMQQRVYAVLAQAADYSHQEDHSYPDLAALAKSNIEFDRGLSLREAGFRVAIVRLLLPQLTAKSDVLVGVPEADGDRSKVASGVLQSRNGWISPFGWVW